ncbi:MAG: hypothetical protein R3Y27_07475 [Clostridia bacterium]
MKKHNLGRKLLSVMLSLVMLASCWVFSPVTTAVAATDDGTYNLTVYVHDTNSFGSSDDSSYLYVWDKDGNLIYEKFLGSDPWESSGSTSTAFTVSATVDAYPAHVQVTSYKNSGSDVSTDPVFSWLETDGRIKITVSVDGVELGTSNSGLQSGHTWITADFWTDASLIPVDLDEIDFDSMDSEEITENLQYYIQQALAYLKFDNDEIKGQASHFSTLKFISLKL